MKMFSFSKTGLMLLLVFVLSGCASQNFVSSTGFEVYISKKRYLNESCENLLKMAREYRDNPKYATRKHMGLELFKYDISRQHETEMIIKNGQYIDFGVAKNCK